MNRKFLILVVVLLIALLPLAAQADGLSFKTTTLSGKEYTSENIGKYQLTMVNVWAEWCGPCVYEMPFLQKLYAENDKLLILGVWVGSDEDEAIQTAEDAGVQYPLLRPKGDLTEYAYKSEYIPATYFFDSTGKQVGKADGYIGSNSYENWKTIISELMADAPQPEQQEDPEEATVTLSESSVTLKGVKSQTITASFSDPEDFIASVKSGAEKVAKASFSANEVYVSSAKEAGTATITVTTAKGATAQLKVTVKNGWALNEKKITLSLKKTFKIKVLAVPGTVKANLFSSNNPQVASVSAKGKVKALKKGKATISVTLTNGKTLKLKVTVK